MERIRKRYSHAFKMKIMEEIAQKLCGLGELSVSHQTTYFYVYVPCADEVM